MSVSLVSSLSGAAVLTPSSTRPATSPGGSTTKAAAAVDHASRQVLSGEQKVDQRRSEADRRAVAAQQAADELKAAKAAMARDQAALAQAKSRASLDVYT
jgi:predicted FMN-binding regulatory protein PaiB